MMKTVYRFLVYILVVILGMIIILHKGSCAEIIYSGRNACNCHGKIIGPGFNRRQNRDPVRISLERHSEGICEFPDKICIFIGTADGIPGVVGMCRKFKI